MYRYLCKGSCLFPEACESVYRHSITHMLPCTEMASNWDNTWPEKQTPMGMHSGFPNLGYAPQNMAGQHTSHQTWLYLGAPRREGYGGCLSSPSPARTNNHKSREETVIPGPDNMAVIPGWEESDSSQEVHPTGEELAEVVSGGSGMGGTGGSMKMVE